MQGFLPFPRGEGRGTPPIRAYPLNGDVRPDRVWFSRFFVLNGVSISPLFVLNGLSLHGQMAYQYKQIYVNLYELSHKLS